MRLEDCSKDELIHVIRRRYPLNPDDIAFDIYMYRLEASMNQGNEARIAANDALGEYIDLLKPYDGKPIGSIPDPILRKASAAMKRRQSLDAKAEKYEKDYNRWQGEIDKLNGM